MSTNLVASSSFSGMDISVYAVISPEALFKSLDAINNPVNRALSSSVYDDPFLFSPTIGSGLDPASELRRETALEHASFSEIVDYSTHFKKLAELMTFSFSVYRDKLPVKRLGKDTVNGYTRGGVIIAGTMIFAIMYEAVLAELFDKSYNDASLAASRIDQLPPIDLFIIFQNETGQISKMAIFGCEFLNEGQVMSVQDLMTENSVNYVARHITRMRSVDSPLPDGADLNLAKRHHSSYRLMTESYRTAQAEIKDLRKYFL